jgi:hypothetical protein
MNRIRPELGASTAMLLQALGMAECHVGADLTSFDPVFKDDYSNTRIINTLNEENQIQQLHDDRRQQRQLGRPPEDRAGEGRPQLVRRLDRHPRRAAAGRPQLVCRLQDPHARHLRSRRVRALGHRAVAQQKGSWTQVMPQEMDGLVEDISFRRNVMGGWTARASSPWSTARTRPPPRSRSRGPATSAPGRRWPNRYCFGDSNSGMFIAILDGTTPTTIKGRPRSPTSTRRRDDVTVDTPITAAAGDYVVIAQTATQNSYNKEPEGMLAMIDDGTYVGTYHNLLRTTYQTMKSFVQTGVGALSLDGIQQPIDAVSIKVGKGIDLFACEHAVRRAYLALLEADRRYTGGDLMRPDGGTKAAKKPTGRMITYGDIPLMVDRDAPYAMLFGIHKSTWVRYVEDEGSWADDEGSVLKWVQGFDEYTAFYKILENYHNHVPSAISAWKASPSISSRSAMPGYFSAPYGAALHFKQRAVVPGSRNPETNSEASFLTILGVAEPTTGGLRIVRRVDDLEDWEPFSDDECREYGMSVEALDRRHMIDPIVPADQVVVTDALTTGAGGKPPAKQPGKPSRVSGGQTTGKGPGAARGGRATQIETTASSVLEPVDPAEHAGLAEMRSDAAAAASEAGRG